MTPDELDDIESLAITEHYAANVLSDGARELAAALREAWAAIERLRDACTGCGSTLVGCLTAPDRGGIKCCPECHHPVESASWRMTVDARGKAEAAIARVRALCDEDGHAVDNGTLRAALDGEAS
jgi:hypothetical protein